MAAGHGDFVSFERSLGAPASGIGAKTIEKIKKYIDENNLYLKDVANTEEISDLISLRMKLLLDEYFQKITKIRTAAKNSVKDAIEAAIGVTGIRDSLDDGSFQNEERLENLKELLSVAEEYSRVRKEFLLTDFLEEIALISDVDNYQEEAEGVTLMTVHTSKGLEFKVVFLVGLEENIFPHARSQLEPMSLEEERRLFYVALTRAREKLYLIYSSRRLYFGSIQNNLPSRFIAEIPPPLLTYLNISGIKVKNLEIKENNVNLQGEFLPGDMIEHEHFGRGTVKKINEDELTVVFPEEGEKVISIYYAPIKKVKSV
jgi:DNA helicase-2/ATP-dependent DNA helicase PcrA